MVADRRHALYGKHGTIAYFVGDNVYVTFAELRWRRTRMLFTDQLQAAESPQQIRRVASTPTLLERLRLALRLRL